MKDIQTVVVEAKVNDFATMGEQGKYSNTTIQYIVSEDKRQDYGAWFRG